MCIIIRKAFNLISFLLKVNIGADATPYIDKKVTASIFYGENGWEGTVYLSDQQYESRTDSKEISEDTGLDGTSYENADTAPIENDGEMRAYTEADGGYEMEKVVAETVLDMANGNIDESKLVCVSE